MAEAKKTAKKVVKSAGGGEAPPPADPDRDLSGAGKSTAPEGKHECAGCQYFYDSYRNPAVAGENRSRERKGARQLKQDLLCCHPSPSEPVADGKKLKPCPGHGESIGLMRLDDDEQAMIHQHRLKKGTVKSEKKH